MSWSKFRYLRRSLVFRLTLLYAGLCGVSLLAVLLVSYLVLQGLLDRQLDANLTAELSEYSALLATQPLDVMQNVLDQEVASEGTDKMFFRIIQQDDTIALTTNTRAWPTLPLHRPALLIARGGKRVFESVEQPGRQAPTRVLYGPAGSSRVFQIGLSTADNAEILWHFERIFLLVAAAFFGCTILAGTITARRVVGGVNRITETARAIASGQWHQRVAVSEKRDEVDQLALAFNEMVDRIQLLVRKLREVSDDIAHDLRTPITRLHITAQSVLRRQREMTGEALAEEMQSECDQLLSLINTMLDISQTESGVKNVQRDPVDLTEIARNVCELFQAAAEDKQIALSFEADGRLNISGDAQGLSRAIAQLLDNAVKYTDPGGTICVQCDTEAELCCVTIRDTGVGIPPEDLPKVFSRFYRGDPSRSMCGNGLGLSLARAIVRAHGGDIRCASVAGAGSSFFVTVPLEANA